ncbi:MAG: hypothetical protein AAB436_02365 [Patescibacteria group bacterium]
MNNLKRTLYSIASALVVASFVSSGSVSAAAIRTANVDLSSASACSRSVSTGHTEAEVKAYGLDRVASRKRGMHVEAALRSVASANQSTYNTKSSSVQSTLTKIANAESYKKAIVGDMSGALPIELQPRKADLTQLIALEANALKIVGNQSSVKGTAKIALDSSSTSKGQKANAVCDAIVNARVFSGVLPEARKQYVLARIDNISLSNSVNKALYDSATNAYNALTSTDPYFDDEDTGGAPAPSEAEGATGQKLSALTDPQDNFVTLDTYAAEASAPTFKDVVGLDAKLTALKKTIATQSQQSKAVFNEIAGAKVNLTAVKAAKVSPSALKPKPHRHNPPKDTTHRGSGPIYTDPGTLR